jgi:hypothetical protein
MTAERSIASLRYADNYEIQADEEANVAAPTTTETSEIVTETEAAS